MLQKYHRIWLEHHPHYDEFWLTQAISAGFDLHHLDGNHDNNDADNLILVEKGDHCKLHGRFAFGPTNGTVPRNCWDSAKKRMQLGEAAYQIRSEESISWAKIAKRLGYEDEMRAANYAVNVASYFAKINKKQWPIPHNIEVCMCPKCRGIRNKVKKRNESTNS